MRRTVLAILVLLCVCLVASTPVFSSATTILRFPIAAGYSLQVPPLITFPTLTPGVPVEGSVTVMVRSNATWSLAVQVKDAPFMIKAQGWQGHWTDARSEVVSIVKDAAKTGEDWSAVIIPIEATAEYALPPGSHDAILEFTVVIGL